MNMQALMKQAQNLQRDMLKTKEEIDNMSFEGKSGFVRITMDGKKLVKSVEIDKNSFSGMDLDDVDALNDMVLLAFNNASNEVDRVTEQKMGKFSSIPGLF